MLRRNTNIRLPFLLLCNSQQEQSTLEDVTSINISNNDALPGDKSSSSIGSTTVNSSRNDTNYFDTSLSIENNNVDDNTLTITNTNSTLEIWGIPLQSILLLNLVAIIWGTQHAVIKSVIDDNITPTKLSFFLDGSTLPILQPFINAVSDVAAIIVLLLL